MLDRSPQDLNDGVHDNLRNLGLDVLDIVNYRAMGAIHGPAEGFIAEQVTVLADLRRQGLIRHIGLSNVTAAQMAEAKAITDIMCVQNNYNLAFRHDDALIDDLARQGIAYVPFFPLGGFSPLQSSTLSSVAGRLGATPTQVELAWLLHRSANMLLIPGTSSVAYLRENLAAGQLALSPQTLTELDIIAAARAGGEALMTAGYQNRNAELPSKTKAKESSQTYDQARIESWRKNCDRASPEHRQVGVLRRLFDALTAVKRRRAADDPELFAAYRTLAADAKSIVDAHVGELVALTATVIRSGVKEGTFRKVDPVATARAVLAATSRFHHRPTPPNGSTLPSTLRTPTCGSC